MTALTAIQPALKRFAPAAPGAVSASLSRPGAQNGSAQPSRARGAVNFSFPSSRRAALRQEFAAAAPVGFITRLIAEADHAARATAKANEFKSSVAALFERAAAENWSLRDLARRAGIPESTLRWLRAGQVDPLAWLPKIQNAIARTNPN